MFDFLRNRAQHKAATALYRGIVAQARRAEFYSEAGVPDTFEGRFELVALHAFLVMRRLSQGGETLAAFNQRLFDLMFAEIDRALREAGVGDPTVGRQVKDMAAHYYGRVAAYEGGLANDDTILAGALDRNLFGSTLPEPVAVARMAAYLRQEAARLLATPLEQLQAGEVRFGDLPPA